MAKKEEKHPTQDFAFGKENYIIMLVGIAVIILGFACMSGGPSKDPNVFDPDIFSFRRITLAPILVILGFIIEVYAVLKKSKE
ncbi:MAG: DUF3098 domain-containing protein [Bacteroidetes bacterium]|nr:DUF3098 domain-containing protein [Bacteroidota bacterium]